MAAVAYVMEVVLDLRDDTLYFLDYQRCET